MTGSPKRSVFLSGLLHAGAIVLLVVTTRVTTKPAAAPPSFVALTGRDLSRYVPTHPHAGGGGGKHDMTPASKGRLPKFSYRVFTPPAVVIRNMTPALAMEPSLYGNPQIVVSDLKLPFGDPNGLNGPPSDGRGKGGGIGDGDGPGVGKGKGPGAGGDDGDGGIGGPGGRIRGEFIAPVAIYRIEPEYSDEARKAHVQGIVVLYIEVGTDGVPRNMRVQQSLGLGLDEKAMEAVGKWRFRPGTRGGKAVVTSAVIEVSFRLL